MTTPPTTPLNLPHRLPKPRTTGLTMMIDPGLATGLFEDVIASHGQYIDLVKFGWGSALVTAQLDRKLACLRAHNVEFLLGGTLFERFVLENRFEEYVRLCRHYGCRYVEVSNGSIPLTPAVKTSYVARLAKEFSVLSEVGYKDVRRSAKLTPEEWGRAVQQDLEAGAQLVVTEARESGRSGIAAADGRLRADVLDAILATGTLPEQLLFEAPTKALQVELIRRLGPNVNLGNIAAADIVSVETLRLGLRADTLPPPESAGLALPLQN